MGFKIKYLMAKLKFFPALFTSDDMIEYLKLSKIKIGKGCRFYRPSNIIVDTSRPELLEIGEYAKITTGVIILAHDYSRSVLRRAYGEIIGEAKKTVVGNNVFIGMNSIILMGANIGDNVIIGAGSVVKGKIPSNTVVAGNPAKVIMSLEDLYKKRKKETITEAKLYIKEFYDRNKRYPRECEMLAFWPLFTAKNLKEIKKHNFNVNLGGDNVDDVIRDFLQGPKPIYNDLESLIKDVENEN